MKRWTILAACLTAAGFTAGATAQTASTTPNPNPNSPGSGRDAFVTDTMQRTFVVAGTVVRARNDQLVLHIDDHGHAMPFRLGPGVEAPAPGSHASVTYHPTGANGQTAEQVQVLQGTRRAEDARR